METIAIPYSEAGTVGSVCWLTCRYMAADVCIRIACMYCSVCVCAVISAHV